MDIRVLRYFLMVAREENITKAAQILHITQPTLSRQLKQLETELGVSLFKRSNHNVYLTEEGILFSRRAEEIVTLAERARSELQQNEELIGEVAVGCGELQSMEELAEMITIFQKEHPQVKFTLHSGNNDNIKAWLEQGLIDLGLLIEPVDVRKYDFIRMKKKEEWGALVHVNSAFSSYDAIRPGDLVGTPVITISDRTVQQELVVWSGKHASNMAWKVRYNLSYNAAMLAKANAGVVICLKLNQSFEDLVFVPFEPKLKLHSILAWHEQKPNSRITNAFIEFIERIRNA